VQYTSYSFCNKWVYLFSSSNQWIEPEIDACTVPRTPTEKPETAAFVADIDRSEGLKMKVIPVRLPEKIIETIDTLVQEGFYANRSAAIRIIVTRYVLEEAEKTERG